MEYKEKVLDYLSGKGIEVGKVEQEGNNESIVCHIEATHNEKIAEIKDEMEKELDVYVAQSDMGGMNVVIVESGNLE